MKISFIGAGNAASHLAKGIFLAGHEIDTIWSRSLENASELAKLISAKSTDCIAAIPTDSDLIIICVPDDYIVVIAQELSKNISRTNFVCHCSGAVSSEVLAPYFNYYGVFYPLQSLSKSRELDASNIPIGITAHQLSSLSQLITLSECFSPLSRVISDEERQLLHLPAVLVNNFTNCMYHIANQYCDKHDLPFDFLFPLIEETGQKVLAGMKPRDAMTGPARRNDQKTIAKHIDLLISDPTAAALYKMISQYISSLYHENRP